MKTTTDSSKMRDVSLANYTILGLEREIKMHVKFNEDLIVRCRVAIENNEKLKEENQALRNMIKEVSEAITKTRTDLLI